MKDLHKAFIDRVSTSDKVAVTMSLKQQAEEAHIEHTAVVVLTDYNENGDPALLVITKYVWLQTDTDERVPCLQDMLQSELVLLDKEVELFQSVIKAMNF